MNTFTNDEKKLISLYCTGGRQELIDTLTHMRGELQQDERELVFLTNSVLAKLKKLTDEEFEAAEIGPEYVIGRLD